MATLRWKSLASVSLPLLFFALFNCSFTATSRQLLQVDICRVVNCGQGTCQTTPGEFPGFKCNCNPGWRKLELPGWENRLCLLPNCTIDFKCGNRPPAPAPTPAPALTPLLLTSPFANLIDPCLLAMCGDGTCEPSGTEYNCKCNEGSSNLLNNPRMLCFNQCSLGSDCNDIGFGSLSPSPSPSSSPSPSPSPSS